MSRHIDIKEIDTNSICSKCDSVTESYYVSDKNEVLCKNCSADLQLCLECYRVVTDEKKTHCFICHSRMTVSKITDKLYISSCKLAQDYDLLQTLGIKQILTVGSELKKHEHPAFKTMKISIEDGSDVEIRKYFKQAHDFIEQDVTLVHCYSGISRSATIVISYLMKKHNMSYNDAKTICTKARPIVNPNIGFVQQLLDFEKEIMIEGGISTYEKDILPNEDLSNDEDLSDSSNYVDIQKYYVTEDYDITELCEKIFNVALYKRKITITPLGIKLFNSISEDIKFK